MARSPVAGGLTPASFSDARIAEMLDRTLWARDLDWPSIETLAGWLSPVRVHRGQRIFVQGDREAFMAIAVEGRVGIYKESTDGGTKKKLGELGRGQMMGEMSLFDGEPRSADAVAESDSVLLVLTRETFDRIAVEHPALWQAMMLKVARMMSQRLRRTSGALVDHL